MQWRLSLPATFFYFIQADGAHAGAIRVIDHQDDTPKKISPLFVMPDFRVLGVAQAAIREAERIHGSENWQLGTILQEEANCHLYEKMGYRQTGETKVINEKLTLVFFEK